MLQPTVYIYTYLSISLYRILKMLSAGIRNYSCIAIFRYFFLLYILGVSKLNEVCSYDNILEKQLIWLIQQQLIVLFISIMTNKLDWRKHKLLQRFIGFSFISSIISFHNMLMTIYLIRCGPLTCGRSLSNIEVAHNVCKYSCLSFLIFLLIIFDIPAYRFCVYHMVKML